ncbi:MAG TPA: DUF2946 family protein [Tepidisphaeraceae bacterium]
MGSRSLRILFVAFQAIWLNAVVPGHTRGVVTLPGWSSSCESTGEPGRSCCARDGREAGRGKSPTPAQKAHCAICFFAARICPPPVIDLTPSPLELLCTHPPVAHETAVSPGVRLTYFGRAPPFDA